jgi:hypothetical protein
MPMTREYSLPGIQPGPGYQSSFGGSDPYAAEGGMSMTREYSLPGIQPGSLSPAPASAATATSPPSSPLVGGGAAAAGTAADQGVPEPLGGTQCSSFRPRARVPAVSTAAQLRRATCRACLASAAAACSTTRRVLSPVRRAVGAGCLTTRRVEDDELEEGTRQSVAAAVVRPRLQTPNPRLRSSQSRTLYLFIDLSLSFSLVFFSKT